MQVISENGKYNPQSPPSITGSTAEERTT